MKFQKPSVTELIIAAVVVAAVAGMFLPTFLRVRSFDHIEERAKKVITAAELQVWATNLLANLPATTNPRISELGTNFPSALLALDQK